MAAQDSLSLETDIPDGALFEVGQRADRVHRISRAPQCRIALSLIPKSRHDICPRPKKLSETPIRHIEFAGDNKKRMHSRRNGRLCLRQAVPFLRRNTPVRTLHAGYSVHELFHDRCRYNHKSIQTKAQNHLLTRHRILKQFAEHYAGGKIVDN